MTMMRMKMRSITMRTEYEEPVEAEVQDSQDPQPEADKEPSSEETEEA